VLALPENLLQFDQGKVFVEVSKGNTFEKRPIKTGLSDGINIEVLGGVSAQEKIKIPGSESAAEG
jgi:HlyD family secretion protein